MSLSLLRKIKRQRTTSLDADLGNCANLKTSGCQNIELALRTEHDEIRSSIERKLADLYVREHATREKLYALQDLYADRQRCLIEVLKSKDVVLVRKLNSEIDAYSDEIAVVGEQLLTIIPAEKRECRNQLDNLTLIKSKLHN